MTLLDANTLIVQVEANQAWVLNPMECVGEGRLPTKPSVTIDCNRMRKFYRLGENILGLHIASLLLWNPKGELLEEMCLENTCEFTRASVMCPDYQLLIGSRRGMFKVDLSKETLEVQ